MQVDAPRLRGISARAVDGSPIRVALTESADGTAVVDTVAVDNGSSRLDADWLDLGNHILLPPAADPHSHLDKALSWHDIDPPLGDLHGAVDAWRAGSLHLDEQSFRMRARTAALELLSNGVTAVRTHVDIIGDDDPLRAVRALLALRDEFAAVMDIQLVVLAPPHTPYPLVEAAIEAGVDFVGGAPHIADDPTANLDALLDIAERHGVGADMHIDEFMDGEHLTIERYALRVRDWPAERMRTAGHCSRLATLPVARRDRIAALLADAGVGVVALPQTNLYLQGRDGESQGRRGITAIDTLRAAGVAVAGGGDNIRDPFNPLGRADPLETAALLVAAAHQTPTAAVDLVTGSARTVMGLPPAGPQVGARADFLAVAGADLIDVVARGPADRAVIVDGRLITRTETHTTRNLRTVTNAQRLEAT